MRNFMPRLYKAAKITKHYMVLKSTSNIGSTDSVIYLTNSTTDIVIPGFTKQENQYVNQQIGNNIHLIKLNGYDRMVLVANFKLGKSHTQTIEYCRLAGAEAANLLNKHKISSVNLIDCSDLGNMAIPFCEGMMLASYQFLKYKKEAEKERNSLQEIAVHQSAATQDELNELKNLVDAVCIARDLVNEPVIYLTAEQLSKDVKALSRSAKFKLTVFNKKKITSLKMGGLLAVNSGSQDPPTFNILEWKPRNATNKKPIILVGKGVTFDTGGMSLKPTKGGMDHMKCDMAGAAAVVGALYAAAKNKLPIHVIGLIPATDNRLGETAYVPGDVIRMHSGLTVEVLNTDAEGRMILADALSYARQLNPELVIDIATLTGASLVTLGPVGMLLMGHADEKEKQTITDCSNKVYERLVELPLWDEYQEMIKSDIADLKNIGTGRFAGSIVAGKFLQNFTDFPWLHIDMATMGWNYEPKGYKTKNGSGHGVRLLYEFLKTKAGI